MKTNYLELQDLSAYTKSFQLSNYIWNMILNWDRFAKDTIGKQMMRSADSISANIAEGFGRYHKKDKILFYRYSYGSIKETSDWIRKAQVRNLISDEESVVIMGLMRDLPKDVHQLIKFTDDKLRI